MLKGIGKQIELAGKDAQGSSDFSPATDRVFDFAENLPSALSRDTKIFSDGKEGVNRGIGTGILGNPSFEFSNPFREWIDIERRCQSARGGVKITSNGRFENHVVIS